MKKLPLLAWLYILVIFLFFFYSYTQVDLDLTFSRLPFVHVIIKGFQYLGYFQRFYSTQIYIGLLLAIFTLYILLLQKAKKNTLSKKQVWQIIIIITGILVFSYNAFSYDFFNYIFDAKIFTYYHQNPYLHKALDFPHDPMLTFMHWTHRAYPYGPAWLLLTIPLSFLGFQFFILTFFFFKLLMAGSYIGSVYFLEKIYKKTSNNNTTGVLVFFALHPLVIIECLVSSHNDIVMMAFLLLAIYILLSNFYFRSFLLFITSVSIKFATLFSILSFFLIYFSQIKKRVINWKLLWMLTIVCMIIAVIIASYRTVFEPWYLLWVLPFCAFVKEKYYVVIPAVIFSFFSLLLYAPYLFFGNWNSPVPRILFWIIISGIGISVLVVTFAWGKIQLRKHIEK